MLDREDIDRGPAHLVSLFLGALAAWALDYARRHTRPPEPPPGPAVGAELETNVERMPPIDRGRVRRANPPPPPGRGSA
jgi:hypothetical protein